MKPSPSIDQIYREAAESLNRKSPSAADIRMTVNDMLESYERNGYDISEATADYRQSEAYVEVTRLCGQVE